MTIYDALTEYSSSDAYPFHMPGHKRRAASLCDPAAIDITEIDGFDNLHHAEGLLRDAQMRAAALYGSSETHFLVNGSTAGILSAIGACARPDACLLMARNSHRSAFNAAALNRVRTAYLYHSPADPEQLKEALARQENVCAVFLTSPTYDGVVSDVKTIAQIAHSRGIPLIVDEAHGAHFGMHRIFPKSSVTLGADLVIHSLHKTLPALTQTALIHVNGSLVDRGRLRRLLSVYQTSSPSYVLMASIDQCVSLLSSGKDSLFDAYAGRLAHFYERTKLKHFSFRKTDDPSRILVCPPAAFQDDSAAGRLPDSGTRGLSARRGISAMELYQTLRERFHLQPEMAAPAHVLMLSSVCDDDEGFRRLSDALLTLDREYDSDAARMPDLESGMDAAHIAGQRYNMGVPCPPAPAGATHCTIAQALEAEAQAMSFSASTGCVSAEYLMLYPPGVPLLVPGEVISEDIIHYAQAMQQEGYSVIGPEDPGLDRILVISSFGNAQCSG